MKGGGRSWIRTSEGVSQQIYSLPPLATWVSYHSPTSLQGRGFKPDPVAPLKRKVLFFKCQPLRRRANHSTATIAWLLLRRGEREIFPAHLWWQCALRRASSNFGL